MDFRSIPTVDDHFDDRMELLHEQISFVVDRDRDASPQVVEDTLDSLLSEPVLESFFDWQFQRPELERDLIETFLKLIVPRTMEVDRKDEHRYQYSLHSEGWCLHPSHTHQPHFIKGKSRANNDFYTFDELVENWKDIFIRDQYLDDDPQLQKTHTPTHDHGKIDVPGLLTVTRHELMIVDSKGKYVPDTAISYARTKSGISYLFKVAEWLTGLRANGEDRINIDDYLAALTRFPDYQDMWVKTTQIIRDVTDMISGDLKNVVRLQRYKLEEASSLRESLIEDSDVGRFVSGRSDLTFELERPYRGLENDRKFGEIFLPVNGNVLGYQVYLDTEYTRSEGIPEQRHDRYQGRKERERLDGFTSWHWSIVRRLMEYFIGPDDVLDPFKKIYDSYLSLSNHTQKLN